MSSELAIGLAGLALGVVNVIAWWIERRDRKAEIAEERDVRNKQVELDQRRFDAEMADREARQRSEITAVAKGFHTDGANRAYRFMIRNLGPSWAKHIHVWLTDQHEELISNILPTGELGLDEKRDVTLQVPLDTMRKSETGRPVLWIGWRDDSGGPHTEPSNVEVGV